VNTVILIWWYFYSLEIASSQIVFLMLDEKTFRFSTSLVVSHFFSYVCHEPYLVSYKTASSSAECSRDKPLLSFVMGQDSTMWDIVWASPQGHRSVSVCKSSFPSAGTAVSLFHVKTVQQIPLLPREVEASTVHSQGANLCEGQNLKQKWSGCLPHRSQNVD